MNPLHLFGGVAAMAPVAHFAPEDLANCNSNAAQNAQQQWEAYAIRQDFRFMRPPDFSTRSRPERCSYCHSRTTNMHTVKCAQWGAAL